jgi:hypothetical protein
MGREARARRRAGGAGSGRAAGPPSDDHEEAWWLAQAAAFRALHADSPDLAVARRRPDGTIERIDQVSLRSAELCERYAHEARQRAGRKDH